MTSTEAELHPSSSSPPPLSTQVDQNGGHEGIRGPTEVPAPTSVRKLDSPIPMSMPSILLNPSRTTNAFLGATSSQRTSAARLALTRKEKEMGRRKARRSENARLASNPHAVRPSPSDYRLYANPTKSTFPSLSDSGAGGAAPTSYRTGLPPPDHVDLKTSEPSFDMLSSSRGQFKMSIKQARRILNEKLELEEAKRGGGDPSRRGPAGPGPVERLVWKAEEEIRSWLEETVFVGDEMIRGRRAKGASQGGKGRVLVDKDFVVLPPSAPASSSSPPPLDQEEGAEFGAPRSEAVDMDHQKAQLRELQRSPNALVWCLPDPFLRLAIHCLSRIYGCPSFSKDAHPPTPQSNSSSTTNTTTTSPPFSTNPRERHTWILNPNPLVRGYRPRSSSEAASGDDGVGRTRTRTGTGTRRRRRRRRSSSNSSVTTVDSLASYMDHHVNLTASARVTRPHLEGLETPPGTDLEETSRSIAGGSVRAWSEVEVESEEAGFISSSSSSSSFVTNSKGVRLVSHVEEDEDEDEEGEDDDVQSSDDFSGSEPDFVQPSRHHLVRDDKDDGDTTLTTQPTRGSFSNTQVEE
ncbi:hypothetical protein IE53DRAFT_382257 [Violaceomyces palustris]|uniref:Uncharacterized protein n=1 Tax=Violaceomyces palustris TaxID=1673888 RepID=A0ACD0NN97_9BASI|nr:hypothetical protein IE53DRAFT_382257 [Violaceomyces palustris]